MLEDHVARGQVLKLRSLALMSLAIFLGVGFLRCIDLAFGSVSGLFVSVPGVTFTIALLFLSHLGSSLAPVSCPFLLGFSSVAFFSRSATFFEPPAFWHTPRLASSSTRFPRFRLSLALVVSCLRERALRRFSSGLRVLSSVCFINELLKYGFQSLVVRRILKGAWWAPRRYG